MDACPLDVIRRALEREKSVRDSYLGLAGSAVPQEVRDLFLYLAEEEAGHARLLADEIEKETHREM